MFIANPCPVDWDKMIGNDQARYCSECNKQVYNLSKMTRDRAEAVVARFEGRLCARFERGDDGIIVTQEEFSSVQLISRRASPVASAIVTAILSLSGSAVAATASQSGEVVPIHAFANAKQPQTSDASATLSVTVLDPQGAVIVGAQLTLKNESTGQERTGTSSEEGNFSFTSLPEGGYALKVEANAFTPVQAGSLALKSGETTQFNVTMQVQESRSLGGVVSMSVSPMQTLRLLYTQSDLIVTVRPGKSVPVKKRDDDSLMKTALDVSATIKGERKRSTVYVYHWGWGEDKKFPGGHTAGDKLLVFLKRSEENKGYEMIDPFYGAKQLPDQDLRIYLKRIEELAAIDQQDTPSIVEWLVRCAEQPATRWEGAYELALSAEQLNEDTEDIDEDQIEVVDPTEEKTDKPAATPNSDNNFSALLTCQQKARLKSALFKTAELKEDDLQLVQLVKHWKDKQLVPYLVTQLRHIEANPPRFAQEIIMVIADLLNDEEITALADDYSANVSYEDSDQEESEEQEADALKTSDDKSEPVEGEVVKINKPDSAIAKQKRSAMVNKFLAAVEKQLAKR